jgi:hypothetical protein
MRDSRSGYFSPRPSDVAQVAHCFLPLCGLFSLLSRAGSLLGAPRIVIPLVAVQFVGSLARASLGPFNRLNCLKHRSKHLRVVQVRCRLSHRQRDPLSFDHKVALRARFAAIRRIRSGRSAPFGAGTEHESIPARLQSILSASPSRSNRRWWRWRHTPPLFQSRNLRQQVTPDPHPSSGGNIAQGMPLRRTKMRPRTTSRLATGGRPPLGLGHSSGSKGRMISHNSSAPNGFDIAIDSIKLPFRA